MKLQPSKLFEIQRCESGVLGVLLYAFEGAEREGERAASVRARDGRRQTVARGREKGFDLGAQRLDILRLKMLRVDAGKQARALRRREVAHRRSSRRVIHGDEMMRLKETHLSDLLSSD